MASSVITIATTAACAARCPRSANPTPSDAGFSVDTNRVTLVDSRGASEELPLLTKTQVAEVILTRVENLLAQPAW